MHIEAPRIGQPWYLFLHVKQNTFCNLVYIYGQFTGNLLVKGVNAAHVPTDIWGCESWKRKWTLGSPAYLSRERPYILHMRSHHTRRMGHRSSQIRSCSRHSGCKCILPGHCTRVSLQPHDTNSGTCSHSLPPHIRTWLPRDLGHSHIIHTHGSRCHCTCCCHAQSAWCIHMCNCRWQPPLKCPETNLAL